MLELKAGAFYEAASRLVGTAAWVAARSAPSDPEIEEPVFHRNTKLDDPSRIFIRSRLKGLPEHLDALGAHVTTLALNEALDSISRSQADWGKVADAFEEITNTLRRELSLTAVLIIEREHREYFVSRKPLFGHDFAEKFKTMGVFELDEAGKCFALGRPTACVFHLMRIMEIGIRALAGCLNIPDPAKPVEKNWGLILKRIKERIDSRWPQPSDRLAGDGLLFESLYASLDAVRNPWRNETMHPASKYTDDEARHLIVAVEGFMKKLSSRMDEGGKPLA
jgi:hypothetical protein